MDRHRSEAGAANEHRVGTHHEHRPVTHKTRVADNGHPFRKRSGKEGKGDGALGRKPGPPPDRLKVDHGGDHALPCGAGMGQSQSEGSTLARILPEGGRICLPIVHVNVRPILIPSLQGLEELANTSTGTA
jgi:hypothetical protein